MHCAAQPKPQEGFGYILKGHTLQNTHLQKKDTEKQLSQLPTKHFSKLGSS